MIFKDVEIKVGDTVRVKVYSWQSGPGGAVEVTGSVQKIDQNSITINTQRIHKYDIHTLEVVE